MRMSMVMSALQRGSLSRVMVSQPFALKAALMLLLPEKSSSNVGICFYKLSAKLAISAHRAGGIT